MEAPNEPHEVAKELNLGIPPLRVHHFFVWTALTATIICGCMSFDRSFRNGSPIENPIVIAGLVLGSATIAGAFAIVGSGIIWRQKGCVFPATLGEWLLVEVIALILFGLTIFALFLATFLVIGDDDWFPFFLLFGGGAALIGWLRFQYSKMKPRVESTAWRWADNAFSIAPALIPLAFWSPATYLMYIVAVIACVMWAAWDDWRKGPERRWTHWAGVALTVSLGISLLCVFVP